MPHQLSVTVAPTRPTARPPAIPTAIPPAAGNGPAVNPGQPARVQPNYLPNNAAPVYNPNNAAPVYNPNATAPVYTPGTTTTLPVYTPGANPATITPGVPMVIPPTNIVPSNPTIITPSSPTVITPTYPTAIPNGHPTIISPATPTTGEQIKKMPSNDKNKGAVITPGSPVLTPTGAKIETEATHPFDLDRRYELRVAHAADYSKLTGQLSFVHTDGGLWVLRYAPLAEEDRYGGSVVLARDRMMNSYREGDLVTIEGRVISQKSSARLGGPLYQVQTISLVDRPQ